MGLAQIGEFSFIIATLGISLKVTSDFLYPIAVAVAAVLRY
jgi:CPA2 family monovalent cation:H+ antiporter-2